MFKKFAIAGVIAMAAAIAVPAVAHADYVEEGDVIVSGDIEPSGTVLVDFTEGSFAPGDVDIIVSGPTGVTFAAVTSGPVTRVANEAGAVSVSIVLPADAEGSYEVTGVQGSRLGVGAFTVTQAGAVAGAPAETTGNGLASTGQDLPLTALFVGGGTLVLGGIVLAAVYTTRRRSVARQN